MQNIFEFGKYFQLVSISRGNIFISICLLTFSLANDPIPNSIPYQLGDPNNDGIVNILDIIMLVDVALTPEVYEQRVLDAGDVNNDENVDIFDLVVLLNYIAGEPDCGDYYHICENNLSICCPDTTRNDYQWTTYEMGDNPSVIFDVEIFAPDNIWLAGEIYVPDSLTGWSPPHNLIIYNGIEWTPLEIDPESLSGFQQTIQIRKIFAFSTTDVWLIFLGIPGHFNGENFYHYSLYENGYNPDNRPMKDMWGASTDKMWFVGNDGLIIYFDGGAFVTQPTITDLDLFQIHGYDENNIWAVGYKLYVELGYDMTCLLHYNGIEWQVVVEMQPDYLTQNNHELIGRICGVNAFHPDSAYVFVDSQQIMKVHKNSQGEAISFLEPEFEWIDYPKAFASTAPNDIVIACDFKRVWHYNGKTMKTWPDLLLDHSAHYGTTIKDGMIITVGDKLVSNGWGIDAIWNVGTLSD